MATSNFYKEILAKAQGIIDAVNALGGGPGGATPGTPQTDTANTGANDFLAADSNRVGFVFRNTQTNDIYLAANATATTANSIAVVQANGYYEAPSSFASASWSAIAPAGSTTFVYIESL